MFAVAASGAVAQATSDTVPYTILAGVCLVAPGFAPLGRELRLETVAGGVLVLPEVAYYGVPIILDVPAIGSVEVSEDASGAATTSLPVIRLLTRCGEAFLLTKMASKALEHILVRYDVGIQENQ